LVNSGMLEAVIGLGAGLFYNSPMEAVVIILRNGRKVSQKNKTLFINAVELVTRERAVSSLNFTHQSEILSIYTNYKSKTGLSTLVDASQIKANDFSLAIPLYVEKNFNEIAKRDLPLNQLFENWFTASKLRDTQFKVLLTEIENSESQ
jgi:type I restriction-modification system DNA methylase subunit